MAMLEIKDIEVFYGVIQAIKGISFEVNEGEVIALIGANGAGKTTILHTITGLLSPKKGSVIFEGKDITKVPAHKIVSLGMAHVPEGRRVFAELSVYQNLKMGAYTRKDKAEIAQTLEMVYKRFPRLEERSLLAITVRIYNRLRSFQEDNRLDRLLAIAEDGVIDDQERPEFEAIIADLRQIIQSGLELDVFCGDGSTYEGKGDDV